MSTEAKKIALLALTPQGFSLALRLSGCFTMPHLYIASKLLNETKHLEAYTSFKDEEKAEAIFPIEGRLGEVVGELFTRYEALIFIMATGIVVRSIAPYVQDKLLDPAILVIDEKGHNVISLLSGHVGGANALTLEVSDYLGANPVITTATDVNQKGALDLLAQRLGVPLTPIRRQLKEVNALLVAGEKVALYSDLQVNLEKLKEAEGFTLFHSLEAFLSEETLKEYKKLIYITYKKVGIQDELPIRERSKVLKLTPKNLVLGVGCRKDTQPLHMREVFEAFLVKEDLSKEAFYQIGSIDIKKDEQAIRTLAEDLALPFITFSKEAIKEVEEQFEKSEFVKKQVGVYAVAEPVAYLLSGHLLIEKQKYEGITFAVGRIKND
ncbi:cobalt-precorrin 5A hydrolase [Sporanaerobium hydrogeniformans]|uniref:Cobalt-precorrin 5A hydrolase n=1 Tax=Sporanaerobium hydrogeniformans TaxID=3072179 RepID=A0AC61DDV2_9FIRM|nr:cobalt-precorrin 5A hydrolase [Sporanaerobium hydrogeniformans]PHV70988.1 cobalt-precorrin 5A hydrolase [Sporanaerobium hydrogeniformans]